MFAKDPRTDVGSLTQLDLRRRGVSGRLYQVVLYGSKGTKTVSADTFRSVYNATKPSVREDAALEPVRHEAHPAAVGAPPTRRARTTRGRAQSSRRRNSAMPASSTSATQATAHAVNARGGGASAKNGFARIASALRAADISSTTGGSRP